MITTDTVWAAYLALRRFAAERNLLPRIFVQRDLYEKTLERLATRISEEQQHAPLDLFDDEYYAYLYLFHQWVRCNLPSGAYFSAATGWQGLQWMALHSFISSTDADRMSWRTWVKTHVNSPELIETVYPWFKDRNAALLSTLDLAVHPWKTISSISAWNTNPHLCRKILLQVLQDENREWEAFVKLGLPQIFKENFDLFRPKLLAIFDRTMQYASHDLQRRWRLKRRILRMPIKKS